MFRHQTWILLVSFLAFVSGQLNCPFSINLFGDTYHILTIKQFNGEPPEKVAFNNGKMFYSRNGKNFTINELGQDSEFKGAPLFKRRIVKVINQYAIQVMRHPSIDNFDARFYINMDHTFVLDQMNSIAFALQMINGKTKLFAMKPDTFLSKHKFIPAHHFNHFNGEVMDFAVADNSDSIIFSVSAQNNGYLKLMKKVHKCLNANLEQGVISMLRDMETDLTDTCSFIQANPPETEKNIEKLSQVKNDLIKELNNVKNEIKTLTRTMNEAKTSKIKSRGKRSTQNLICIESEKLLEIEQEINEQVDIITNTIEDLDTDFDGLLESAITPDPINVDERNL